MMRLQKTDMRAAFSQQTDKCCRQLERWMQHKLKLVENISIKIKVIE
jgi:hypothetical protein